MFDALFTSWMIWPVVAFVGACVGSFISLISHRIPNDLPWMATRSKCPACHTPLATRDLIPVVSYLVSGRKCRYCAAPMSARYVWIELFTAASFVGLFALKGPTLEWAILAALMMCVITMIVTDLEHYMIPDIVQVMIFLLGIAYGLNQAIALDARLQNAAMLFGVGLVLHYGYFWLMGKHGLGFGDVKLLGAIGVWIELSALPVFLFLSGIIGIMTALSWRALGLGKHYPFGPALALAMLVLVVWPASAQLFHLLVLI